ncbi:MAG: DEAD/DEAH box helicase [Phycisphaerae bacterium]|nr:DEAD/DEAH box helicase [Phycisphaerae bacterium]
MDRFECGARPPRVVSAAAGTYHDSPLATHARVLHTLLTAHETFDTSRTFGDLGLPEPLLRAVTEKGFTHPTRIQAALIPPAIAGRDCLGQAKTGTGKTAAFGLPMLARLDPKSQFTGLILVPTRELAVQVTKEMHDLARHSHHHVAAIYGGHAVRAQAHKLEKGVTIVVGTPGRIMDMHSRGLLPYHQVRFAVLDEVDRMLDIGFRDDIRKILGSMKQRPQTVFVSATIAGEIERLARSYMNNPEKLVTFEKSLTVSQVKQSYFSVEPWDKRRLLLHLLTHEEPDLTVVFCRTKRTVDTVAEFLSRHKIDAHAMHGDMFQKKRDRVMDRLRGGELSVLVASDLAARGLDVEDISHVVNYDLPEDPEVYIHRIGRTARAGREGVAWSFVCPDQGELLTAIEMLANVEIPRTHYEDFTPGPVPADVSAQRDLDAKRREHAEKTKNRFAAPPPASAAPGEAPPAADPSKFPGGLVPTAMPQRRLGGRVPGRRR